MAVLPAAMGVSALALVGPATITEAWQLVALFGLMGVAGLAGAGSLVTSVPIATLGNPIGGAIFVPLTRQYGEHARVEFCVE